MSRQKTDHIAFASADAKLCAAFFDILTAAAGIKRRLLLSEDHIAHNGASCGAARKAAASAAKPASIFESRPRPATSGSM